MYSRVMRGLRSPTANDDNADRLMQLLLIAFFREQMNHSQASAEARVDQLEQYLRAHT